MSSFNYNTLLSYDRPVNNQLTAFFRLSLVYLSYVIIVTVINQYLSYF